MSDEREVCPGIPGLNHLKKNQVVEPWDPRAHFLPGIGLGRLGDNSAGIIFFNRNPLTVPKNPVFSFVWSNDKYSTFA
jgi:hypothetical protein